MKRRLFAIIIVSLITASVEGLLYLVYKFHEPNIFHFVAAAITVLILGIMVGHTEVAYEHDYSDD